MEAQSETDTGDYLIRDDVEEIELITRKPNRFSVLLPEADAIRSLARNQGAAQMQMATLYADVDPARPELDMAAREFGRRFGKDPIFEGEVQPDGWYNNTLQAQRLFGYPTVPLAVMIDWVADWMQRDMELTRANQLTLISVLCLIPFNLGTGWALDRGISATWLYVVAFMVMAASPVLILWSSTTPVVTWLGAILFGAAAGVVPSIVWAQVPRLARSSDEAPSVSGLIYQGAGIGQIIGPLAAGAAVEFTGNWLGPAGVIGGFCILGVIFAFLKTSRVHRVG